MQDRKRYVDLRSLNNPPGALEKTIPVMEAIRRRQIEQIQPSDMTLYGEGVNDLMALAHDIRHLHFGVRSAVQYGRFDDLYQREVYPLTYPNESPSDFHVELVRSKANQEIGEYVIAGRNLAIRVTPGAEQATILFNFNTKAEGRMWHMIFPPELYLMYNAADRQQIAGLQSLLMPVVDQTSRLIGDYGIKPASQNYSPYPRSIR